MPAIDRYTRFSQIVLSLLALLLLAGGLAGCSSESGASSSSDKAETAAKEKNTAPLVKVRTEDVRPTPLKDILVLPAETEALHDVSLSSETAGRVEWVGVTEGDAVKRDQVLVKIDLNSLAASLDRAQAHHDLAEATAERRRKLFKSRVLSREELEQAETDLLKAKSDLRTARVNYDQGMVRAPISGSVEHVHVDPGEYVMAGDPVVDLVDIDTLRINVNVPEMDIRFIRPGQKARVTVDAWPDAHWTGEVDFVAHKADPATKTFHVRVVVDNADRRIRPGMIARVRFVRRMIDDAVTAPLFAILDRGGERLVYVAEDGKATARTVELGVIDEDRVQVLEGLQVGDRLIVEGQNMVEEGTRVEVQ